LKCGFNYRASIDEVRKIGKSSCNCKNGIYQIVRICQRCGNEFTRKVSHVKRGDVKYCNRKCKYPKRKKCACEMCGKVFYVNSYRYKKDKPKFCSRKCKFINKRKVKRNPIISKDSVLISLTQNKYAEIDKKDLCKVFNRNWWAKKDKCTWYAYGKDGNKNLISMHRLLMAANSDEEVDHIDGNGLNNKRNNLRICNRKQNTRNRNKSKVRKFSSNFIGVSFNKNLGKYISFIGYDNIQETIGHFEDEIDAAKARDERAKEVFKEFAKLNFE